MNGLFLGECGIVTHISPNPGLKLLVMFFVHYYGFGLPVKAEF